MSDWRSQCSGCGEAFHDGERVRVVGEASIRHEAGQSIVEIQERELYHFDCPEGTDE